MSRLHLWHLELLWDPHEICIGLHWHWSSVRYGFDEPWYTHELHLYVTLLPCVVLHAVLGREVTKEEA